MLGKRQNWFWVGNISLRLNNYYCLQRNCTLTLISFCISPPPTKTSSAASPAYHVTPDLAWYFLVTKQFELHSDNVLGGPEFVQCNPATSDPGLWLGGRWREFLNLRPICVWDTLWKIISCKNVDWEGWSWRSIYWGHAETCSCKFWTLYYTSLWFLLFTWVKWNIWILSLCPVRFYFENWLN